MTHKTVLIAGATGYLGQHLIEAYAHAGYSVRALARAAEKLGHLSAVIDQVIVAEATQPETLKGAFDGVDLAVSALGITRQRDGLTYDDVDYQANLNLLDAAQAAGVDRFAYVHVHRAKDLQHVDMVRAKTRFVSALQAADIQSTVICPSGFFVDLEEVLKGAQSGRAYLFGDGEALMSPIHGADLAKTIAETTQAGEAWRVIGGPEVLTQNQIVEAAFNALGKPTKITHLPAWLGQALVGTFKRLGMKNAVGAIAFFVAASRLDMSAPPFGVRTLSKHFKALTSNARASDLPAALS